MLDLNNFYVKEVSVKNGFGVFNIGPLPRGYGHTIANSLRRILLSSLTGAAITSVKIAGAEHEYTTIKGVHEDVLTLILRLKAIVIKSYSDDPVRIRLNVDSKKGETKTITAADIEADASIEIVNKDLVIATISDGGKINAEFTVEKGTGFRSSDSMHRSEIGFIPVDAIFSPVENVKLTISNARVGQKTDYDQITVEITTDKSITPTESLQEALSIYSQIINRFLELVQGDMKGAVETKQVRKSEETTVDEMGIMVKDLSLSTRLKNALTNSAITDLRVLDGKTKEELLEIKGMGKKSADELVDIMKSNNLTVLE